MVERLEKPGTKKLEIIIGLLFLMPYAEISSVKQIFQYQTNSIMIPASIFLMSGVSIVLWAWMKVNKKGTSLWRFNNIIYINVILDITILLRGLYVHHFLLFFAQFLWFVTPIFYAITVITFINAFELSASRVGKIGLFYFLVYLCINIVINVRLYGFAISGTASQSRLLSPGGGPVILGYTIVLMTCYLLYLRRAMTRRNALISICILLAGGILSGSRGAVWPMMLFLMIYALTSRKSNIQVFGIIVLGIMVVLIDPISLLDKIAPRVIDLSGGARADTLSSAMQVYSAQPIFNQLFGTGLSQGFPYQAWLIDSSHFLAYNNFIYNGLVMLVQPHDSFVYLLLETGLVGVILFISIFITFAKLIRQQSAYGNFYKYIFLICVVLLNCLDSVFIIQPGSAGLWWVLLFLIVYDSGATRTSIECIEKPFQVA